MSKQKMWVTDLDGTLLNNNEMLPVQLEEAITHIPNTTIKVVATGRNLEKVKRVLPDMKLFDYIIFSSGAGIYHPKTQEIIQANNLSTSITQPLFECLNQKKQNFIFSKAIPFNAAINYKKNYPCNHFDIYINAHQKELDLQLNPSIQDLAQFMIFIPNHKDLIERLTREINSLSNEIQVIRATSPIDSEYCWLEIFSKAVSKGKAVNFLSKKLSIEMEEIIGVGNDYNDLDFLSIIGNPYVVRNSPEPLKSRFDVVSSNNDMGVLEVLKKHGIA